jgi:hypothetical protein
MAETPSHSLRLHAILITLAVGLAGCASLQPHTDQLALHSYEAGCTMRSEQDGLSRQQAVALCECHTSKAIEQTSIREFVEIVTRFSRASREERSSPEFSDERQLMRSTFKDCRQKMGLPE